MRLSLTTTVLTLAAIGALPLSSRDSDAGAGGSLRLPKLFASGMVVQRNKPVVIWGWGAPRSTVTVSLDGRTARATVSESGDWKTQLPGHSAGGPFELLVASGADSIRLIDVLVGDVWVASGQSNMEFPLAQSRGAAEEIAAANDPELRQFKVPTSWSKTPEADLAGGSWAPADPAHAGAFSGVAYYFAKALRRSVGVPIGIINTTWGGSNIETWISRPAAHIDDAAWRAIVQKDDAEMAAFRDSLRARLGELPTKDPGLVDGRAIWADSALDDSRWVSIHVPAYWEGQGFPGMDGVAWYRLAIDLTAADIRQGVTLTMDAIDDDDITWVNGVEVGRTNGYNVARFYRLPSTALVSGRNVIAVRVVDGGGGGGINAPASLVFGDGSRRSLAGEWKFKVGEVSFQPDGQRINKVPSVLYNRMLHPLLPFPIKGVIWYQGESNANNLAQARAYRGQFETLIQSWRHEWDGGRDAFPFLWVQLPNFGTPDRDPPSDAAAAWAAQRESMEGALALPNTGRAVAIDIGDGELHPLNKKDVGERLARVAQRSVYGEKVIASGPTYRSHTVRGDTVVIEFSNIAGGLHAAADKTVGAFTIAGSDRAFVWASATIVGNTVHVWSDGVKKPVAVRYAWANNPDRANLYNGENLPAAPFRTDRW